MPSSYSPIKSLPKHLLVEVVGRVAVASFDDLYRVKLCSKDFLDATEDDYVFQNMTLDKFPYMDWFPNKKK